MAPAVAVSTVSGDGGDGVAQFVVVTAQLTVQALCTYERAPCAPSWVCLK